MPHQHNQQRMDEEDDDGGTDRHQRNSANEAIGYNRTGQSGQHAVHQQGARHDEAGTLGPDQKCHQDHADQAAKCDDGDRVAAIGQGQSRGGRRQRKAGRRHQHQKRTKCRRAPMCQAPRQRSHARMGRMPDRD
jgi:hypothetical protein